MNPTIRAFLSVFAGIATGVILINIGHSLSPYQPAAGIDYTNPIAYSEWLKSLPDHAFGIMLAIFLFASFAGGFVTGWIAPPALYFPPFITGFAILFYNIVTVLAFPNPAWMSYSSCVGCVAFALLSGWLARVMKKAM